MFLELGYGLLCGPAGFGVSSVAEVISCFSCLQVEPADSSTPEPEGQSFASEQRREEEGQVGESAEQAGETGNR